MRFVSRKYLLSLASASLFGFFLALPVHALASSADIAYTTGATSQLVRVERLRKTAFSLLGGELASRQQAGARMSALHLPLEELKGAIEKNDDAGIRTIGVDREMLGARKTTLERLIRLYASYLALLDDADTGGPSHLSGSAAAPLPPYSIADYDSLRFEYESLRKRLEESNFMLKLRGDETALRIDVLQKSEYARRIVGENTRNPAQSWRYDTLLLENETDRVLLTICIMRIDIELDYNRRISEALKKTASHIRTVRPSVLFSKDELNDVLGRIESAIEAKQSELEAVAEQIRQVSSKLAELDEENRYRFSSGTDERQRRNEIYAAAASSEQAARFAYATAQDFAVRYKSYTLSNEINFLNTSVTFWRSRYEIMNESAAGNRFWNTRNEAKIAVEDMQLEERYVSSSLEDLRFAATLITRAVAEISEKEGASDAHLEVLHDTLELLHETADDIGNTYGLTIQDYKALSQAIVDETTEKMDAVRLMQRVREGVVNLKNSFMARVIWHTDNFEITAYDVTRGVLVLVLGYFVSALLSDLVAKLASRKARKVGADAHLARTAKRISFSICWLIFFMLALDSINVPLTALAFLGGSLALAMGFGAQEICKNFISGAIILFNRPFRAGDIVNVDDLVGFVGEIGPRCTTITTFDDVEVLVPNSYFIDNKVINYTRTSPVARQSFDVVVSSSHDASTVERVLQDVVGEYEGRKDGEKPYVTLTDVSRDAFTYTLYYWLDLKGFDDDITKGLLRKAIVLRFAEEKIELYQPELYRNP